MCARMYVDVRNCETIVQLCINMVFYWHLSGITHRMEAQHFALYPLDFKSTRLIALAEFHTAEIFSMKQE